MRFAASRFRKAFFFFNAKDSKEFDLLNEAVIPMQLQKKMRKKTSHSVTIFYQDSDPGFSNLISFLTTRQFFNFTFFFKVGKISHFKNRKRVENETKSLKIILGLQFCAINNRILVKQDARRSAHKHKIPLIAVSNVKTFYDAPENFSLPAPPLLLRPL